MGKVVFFIFLVSIFSFTVLAEGFEQVNDANMEKYLLITKEVSRFAPPGKFDPSKGAEIAFKIKAVCDKYNVSMLEYATFSQKIALGIAQIEGVDSFVPLSPSALSPDESKIIKKYLSKLKATINEK
ncbi:MAG: hypothetical protein K9L86_07110 [Candidatus Omnitrophica bacterium]|nr:hypothetical protein [Candidatus Omnitrophota bacterium]